MSKCFAFNFVAETFSMFFWGKRWRACMDLENLLNMEMFRLRFPKSLCQLRVLYNALEIVAFCVLTKRISLKSLQKIYVLVFTAFESKQVANYWCQWRMQREMKLFAAGSKLKKVFPEGFLGRASWILVTSDGLCLLLPAKHCRTWAGLKTEKEVGNWRPVSEADV